MNTRPDDAFDLRRKFVRVTGSPRAGMVAFEFSIGSPVLTVELLLPSAAFDEFCAAQQVERLDD
ncbi:MAG: phenol hydroxylase [Burkholderiales bacterium]|nr:phenol hydroxylase [Burkholderiales bacterium]MDE2454248.1 phenol hydroxylase [Burkholderiales bacterium]